MALSGDSFSCGIFAAISFYCSKTSWEREREREREREGERGRERERERGRGCEEIPLKMEEQPWNSSKWYSNITRLSVSMPGQNKTLVKGEWIGEVTGYGKCEL